MLDSAATSAQGIPGSRLPGPYPVGAYAAQLRARLRQFVRVQLVGELWAVVESPEKGKDSQRLRAAAALAQYDPESDKWAKAGVLVVHELVRHNPVYLLYWSEAFRPVRASLLAPLSEVYRDHRPEQTAERFVATYLLADYAADNPRTLAELLMDAVEKQFGVIFPVAVSGSQARPLVAALLTAEIDKKPAADLPS